MRSLPLLSPLPLVLVLLPLLAFPGGLGAARASSIRQRRPWWGIAQSGTPSNLLRAHGGPAAAAEPTDLALAPLGKRQRRLVRHNPGVLHSALASVHTAVRECKWQFRHRRWDCPTTGSGPDIFGKILQRGCRETAFIHAVMSAALAHGVARACSEGSIASCTCDYGRRGRGGPDWEWGGCSDNLPFGTRFARELAAGGGGGRGRGGGGGGGRGGGRGRGGVAGERGGRDARALMDRHNEEAGMRTVDSEMRRECKCHGMSGSCALKTCWLRLPPFRAVGDRLKERFDGATQVADYGREGNRASKDSDRGGGSGGGGGHLRPADPAHKPPGGRDLVYVDESPEFCHADTAGLSWPGTRGRVCVRGSPGLGGCELLCCGRGWTSREARVSERCLCTFHWCCTVTCQNCTRVETVHECL
ncbi:proto-oncogene Wnt-1 [Petromyzon marinus]|uniref:proto-oncogene Wnt-1 n=1 Tax=Petromyzon marinus TaxID=7757 RepID=UPI003F70F52C